MGHGFTPPRDRGLGASASRSTVNDGKVGGGPSSPGGYPAKNTENTNNSSGNNKHSKSESFAADPWASPVAASRGIGRKRKSGGGPVGTSTTPRTGALGKEFPAISSQQQQQQPVASSPPAEGDEGAQGEGDHRRGRRRGPALRMGWINSRRSQGTIQELLRTT